MTGCRWGDCTARPYTGGVCRRHHTRMMQAGQRAARGASPAEVRAAIMIAERSTAPITDRLEDLTFLLQMGEWPERAAHRCGWTVEGAATIARRRGHPIIVQALNEVRT